MRVGFDGRPLQPGFKGHFGRGFGVYTRELLSAMARIGGAELVVFLDPRLPVPERCLPERVERRDWPAPRIRIPLHHALVTQWWVARAVARAGVDVFHFPVNVDAPAWGAGPTVLTVHDLILLVLERLYAPEKPLAFRVARALERAAIRRATFVLTVSETTRADLIRILQVEPERSRAAPLGVHPRFRPSDPGRLAEARARWGLERPFVAYVGGIEPHKNVRQLLEAFARVRARRRDPPDLAMLGDVSRHPRFPALRSWAGILGLEDCVRWTGAVPDDDLPALLGAADLLACPSLYEGFGLPPVEAMACGTPVVATRAGALPEVLGEAAWLVPAGDAAALAEGIERVLADAALRARLRERGLRQAARYTWEATARVTLEAYAEARDRWRADPRRR